MFGDAIYARAISVNSRPDKGGTVWQYHPRSDAHSKAACWGIIFDMLLECPLLRRHVEANKVGFGINHVMHDYRLNRKKNLDLVICTPSDPKNRGISLVDLARKLALPLTPIEQAALNGLPELLSCNVGTTLLALEAKACMTEHSKARPRLYDELSSSFQTILGDSQSAIAAGFVSINTSDTFISPLRNKANVDGGMDTTVHGQPKAALGVLQKVGELPRRSSEDGFGFDALGVSLIQCKNDGSEVSIVRTLPDGGEVDEILKYETLVTRISAIYSSRFRGL